MREVLQSTTIDESRILTEAAIFADKIAVDEETVRLRSHISQLKGMLETGSPIGRKIDFLVQEFNREANTIGSKCQNSDVAHIVVDLKSDIEKIREQIQNIEYRIWQYGFGRTGAGGHKPGFCPGEAHGAGHQRQGTAH